MAQQADADLNEIGKRLAEEEALRDVVLSRVNAPETGLKCRVDDPTHAAAILGVEKLSDVLQEVLRIQDALDQQAGREFPRSAD